MAKKEVEQNVLDELEVVEEKPSFFKKLFFWVIIPLTFALAVLLIVANFTNTNIFGFADKAIEKLPFVKSEQEQIENTTLNTEQIVTLQAEIQEKEAQVTQLQTELDSAAKTNEELTIEMEKLQFEIEKLQREQQEYQMEFQEILKTYESMSAKKAAPIITAMSDQDALRILSNMKSDTLAELFSKMSPEDAARYTKLLAAQ
ncbi:MAG: MotE family protein [Lysinibacillus sp.]